MRTYATAYDGSERMRWTYDNDNDNDNDNGYYSLTFVIREKRKILKYPKKKGFFACTHRGRHNKQIEAALSA